MTVFKGVRFVCILAGVKFHGHYGIFNVELTCIVI